MSTLRPPVKIHLLACWRACSLEQSTLSILIVLTAFIRKVRWEMVSPIDKVIMMRHASRSPSNFKKCVNSVLSGRHVDGTKHCPPMHGICPHMQKSSVYALPLPTLTARFLLLCRVGHDEARTEAAFGGGGCPRCGGRLTPYVGIHCGSS